MFIRIHFQTFNFHSDLECIYLKMPLALQVVLLSISTMLSCLPLNNYEYKSHLVLF